MDANLKDITGSMLPVEGVSISSFNGFSFIEIFLTDGCSN